MVVRSFLVADWITREILPLAFEAWAESAPHYAETAKGRAARRGDWALRTLDSLGLRTFGARLTQNRAKRSVASRASAESLRRLPRVYDKVSAETALGVIRLAESVADGAAESELAAADILYAVQLGTTTVNSAIAARSCAHSLITATSAADAEALIRPERVSHPFMTAHHTASWLRSYAYDREISRALAESFAREVERRSGHFDSLSNAARDVLSAYEEAFRSAHPSEAASTAREGALRAIAVAFGLDDSASDQEC
jgi:hypothetical protein